jgi:hypothetical protein
VGEPKNFFLFVMQNFQLKLFYMTHKFDSGGFLVVLAHGVPSLFSVPSLTLHFFRTHCKKFKDE